MIDVLLDRGLVAGDGAHGGALRPVPVLSQPRFDRVLDFIRQLCATAGEELDAIVRMRVVGGRDHHAQVGTTALDQVGEAGRGQNACVEHVHAGGGEPRCDRGGQEITGGAGVMGDDRAGPLGRVLLEGAEIAEHVGGGHGQFDSELRRDVLVGDAAHAVSAEESSHGCAP